jgi:hypothetical protein
MLNNALKEASHRINPEELFKAINICLGELCQGRETSPITVNHIHHWLRPLSAGSKDLRVPPTPAAVHALVNAMHRLKVWRDREPHRKQEMRALVELLGFEFKELLPNQKDSLVEALLKRDIVVVSGVCRRQKIGDLEIMRNPVARGQLIDYLLKSDGRFLSVSVCDEEREWNNIKDKAGITALDLPGVFLGDLSALAIAMKESASNALAILKSVQDRLRFGIMEPNPPHYYGFCRPRQRVLMGVDVGVGKENIPINWYESLFRLHPENIMVLGQHDQVKLTLGQKEHEDILCLLDAQNSGDLTDLVKWFTELPRYLTFYQLADDIENVNEFEQRLSKSPKPIPKRV